MEARFTRAVSSSRRDAHRHRGSRASPRDLSRSSSSVSIAIATSQVELEIPQPVTRRRAIRHRSLSIGPRQGRHAARTRAGCPRQWSRPSFRVAGRNICYPTGNAFSGVVNVRRHRPVNHSTIARGACGMRVAHRPTFTGRVAHHSDEGLYLRFTDRNLHDKNASSVFGRSYFDAPDVVGFVHRVGAGHPARSHPTNGAHQPCCHGDDIAQRLAGLGSFHG